MKQLLLLCGLACVVPVTMAQPTDCGDLTTGLFCTAGNPPIKVPCPGTYTNIRVSIYQSGANTAAKLVGAANPFFQDPDAGLVLQKAIDLQITPNGGGSIEIAPGVYSYTNTLPRIPTGLPKWLVIKGTTPANPPTLKPSNCAYAAFICDYPEPSPPTLNACGQPNPPPLSTSYVVGGTCQNVWIEQLKIDGSSATNAGYRGGEILTTEYYGAHNVLNQSFERIIVRDVQATGIAYSTNFPADQNLRAGVTLNSYVLNNHPAGGQPVVSAKDMLFEDLNLEGGNSGVAVTGGCVVSGGQWPFCSGPTIKTNAFVDKITVRNLQHKIPLAAPYNVLTGSATVHLGFHYQTKNVQVLNSRGENETDECFEANNVTCALFKGNSCVNPFGAGFYNVNFIDSYGSGSPPDQIGTYIVDDNTVSFDASRKVTDPPPPDCSVTPCKYFPPSTAHGFVFRGDLAGTNGSAANRPIAKVYMRRNKVFLLDPRALVTRTCQPAQTPSCDPYPIARSFVRLDGEVRDIVVDDFDGSADFDHTQVPFVSPEVGYTSVVGFDLTRENVPTAPLSTTVKNVRMNFISEIAATGTRGLETRGLVVYGGNVTSPPNHQLDLQNISITTKEIGAEWGTTLTKHRFQGVILGGATPNSKFSGAVNTVTIRDQSGTITGGVRDDQPIGLQFYTSSGNCSTTATSPVTFSSALSVTGFDSGPPANSDSLVDNANLFYAEAPDRTQAAFTSCIPSTRYKSTCP